VGSHLRQADALAQLRCSFELLLEFAEQVGALESGRAEELRTVAAKTLQGIGDAQGTVLKELEPAERFVSILGTLLEQRRVRLLERGSSPRADDVEAIGWFDADYAYLLPEAARRRVATFLREAGEGWAYSAHALNKALVRRGVVIPGPDARPEMQVRVGDAKRRVLRMPLSALRGIVPESVPGLSPAPEVRAANRIQLENQADTGERSPVSPVSPIS
jgi:hypothetical protein